MFKGLDAGERELPKRLLPRPPGRRLRVLRGPILEEVRVLDGVQHLVHPGQRVLGVAAVDRLKGELGEAAVGDVADVALDVSRGHAFDAAELEG